MCVCGCVCRKWGGQFHLNIFLENLAWIQGCIANHRKPKSFIYHVETPDLWIFSDQCELLKYKLRQTILHYKWTIANIGFGKRTLWIFELGLFFKKYTSHATALIRPHPFVFFWSNTGLQGEGDIQGTEQADSLTHREWQPFTHTGNVESPSSLITPSMSLDCVKKQEYPETNDEDTGTRFKPRTF